MKAIWSTAAMACATLVVPLAGGETRATAFMVKCQGLGFPAATLTMSARGGEGRLAVALMSDGDLGADVAAAVAQLGIVADQSVRVTGLTFELSRPTCVVNSEDHAVFRCTNGWEPTTLRVTGKGADDAEVDRATDVTAAFRQIRVEMAGAGGTHYEAALSLEAGDKFATIGRVFARCFSNSN